MTDTPNLLAMQGFAELLEVYLRKSAYKSHRSFAKAAGIAPSTLHGCLRGTKAPPIEKLPRIIKALRLTVEQARDFTFAAYRTKGWSQQKARPYILMAEEVLAAAAEEQRRAEADLQDANRRYGEQASELAWHIKRVIQLEAEVKKAGIALPPPPPHPMPPSTPAPPPGSDPGSASGAPPSA